MEKNQTIRFFDTQFERKVRERDFVLNPFETRALPMLRGKVLDMGCGVGNLSVEAARRGCSVVALDASPSAIDWLEKAAFDERLPLVARQVDFTSYLIREMFDTTVAIGLFMFFPRPRALELLADAQNHVNKDGVAVVNVLIEGTTYLDMFEPGRYYLFGERELEERFSDWEIVESRLDRFDAPRQTVKAFSTVIARKPGSKLRPTAL